MSDAPKRQTYSVRLRPEVIDRLRHFAIDEHALLSDLLERAIEDLLDKAGQNISGRGKIGVHRNASIPWPILDPNQGVTGKGLWRLQTGGVEVALFPHNLAQQIRALNAVFIRTQETLGATIISPKNGETLKTYET